MADRHFIQNPEKGAALIMVMALVSVISAAAVLSFETLGLFIQSSTHNKVKAQAREYALAGEIFGAHRAGEYVKNYALMRAFNTGNVTEISVPIEGGIIEGELNEKSNCFNLTSLVRPESGRRAVSNEQAMRQFTIFLQEFNIGRTEAMALTAALTDWQDTDSRPLPMGAEANSYVLSDAAHHVPNSPLVSLKDLRQIRGFTLALLDTILPFVCFDPNDSSSTVNVNSLELHHLPLLKALFADLLTRQEVTKILNDKPIGGYEHIREFWQHPVFGEKKIPESLRAQFSDKPKRFDVVINVRMSGARLRMKSGLHFHPDGSYSIISREFGV